MKVKRLIAAAFLTVAATALAGCSAQIYMDEKTGVVEINGIAANDLIDMLGLDYNYEVNVDPDSGEITVNGITISGLTGLAGEGSEHEKPENTAEDTDENEEDQTGESSDVFEECGVSLNLPDDFDDMLGIFDRASQRIGNDADIFVLEQTYIGVPEEWLDTISDLEEISEEEADKLYGSFLELPWIWCAKKSKDVSDIADAAWDELALNLKDGSFTKVGEAGDYYFYRYFDDDQENFGNLGRDFEEEYEKLCELMDEAIYSAVFSEPVK